MATETDNLLDDVRAAATEIAGGGNAPVGRDDERPALGPEEGTAAAGAREAGETAEQAAERARDEKGRFAKAEEGKPRETLKLKEKPTAAATTPPQTTPTTPETAAAPAQPKPTDEPIAPPAEWKGAGKVQWNKLPKAVQAELRETYEGLARDRAQFAPLEQAIAPHREAWVRDAGSVENAIGQLGQFYRLYLDNPVGLIQHIARTRGIDLGAPQGQPQQGTPQQAPDINSLIAQTVQQAIAPIQQRFAQTEEQQTQQTIAAFAADPRYPYFQDVKAQMGQLLTAGIAKDLPDAYDKAVRLTPAIWSQLESERAEEAKKAHAAEVEKANRAKAASLRGSPLPNGSAATGSGATVLDDVRAAAAEIAGA